MNNTTSNNDKFLSRNKRVKKFIFSSIILISAYQTTDIVREILATDI